jgi:hypothetical protein
MFLISISALLMVIGLAETQKPPVLAQTSLSSKALPARNFQSQQSRNSQVNVRLQLPSPILIGTHGRDSSTSLTALLKKPRQNKNYILNVMFMIENSFLDFKQIQAYLSI